MDDRPSKLLRQQEIEEAKARVESLRKQSGDLADDVQSPSAAARMVLCRISGAKL